ncbi:MAG: thiamine-binding protein [Clostridiales Family XIII bacterium]|jgi:uncharacterized protein YqgV (UPF0045/DUF77 family)|nr:thiamine-binding protein [Clostridiales Family XIII bacterium]
MEKMMNKPEASMAIQILPTTKNATEEEVFGVVDAAIARLKASGLNVFVGPFESTVEGPLETLLELQKELIELSVKEGAISVAVYSKIFYSPEKGTWTIDEKVAKHQ